MKNAYIYIIILAFSINMLTILLTRTHTSTQDYARMRIVKTSHEVPSNLTADGDFLVEPDTDNYLMLVDVNPNGQQ